jgi:photosystem II stability/assembly factor-like uncharacterized protein
MHHVHGLAYSADGQQLVIPSHHGLAIYRDGKWSKAPGPAHDYMGFAAARTRLYSSGHPAEGSGLVNPFGLIRSDDGGRTWHKRGLEGETDFHILGVSWNTNAIYVWNPEPSSKMRATGVHYTLNDGFTWQRAAAKGIRGKPHAIAVHPADSKIVAIATAAGIFLSRDSGDSFEPVPASGQGLTVFFDLDGKHLWHASYDRSPRLSRTALQGGVNTAATLPALTNDAVAYVAQHPAVTGEYAIATFERSVYISKDAGKTWKQVADRGSGK